MEGKKTDYWHSIARELLLQENVKLELCPDIFIRPGHVGVVSRSGTLTYEAVHQLSTRGIGQSTAVGIGGDPVNGTSFIDMLALFNEDPDTYAVIMIGEIGGTAEEEAAEWIKANMTKPVVGFIGGQTASRREENGSCWSHYSWWKRDSR